MLNEFIAYLEEQIKNMSIYVWGAQGQTWPVLCEAWIKRHETNAVHRAEALKTYRRACEAGHEKDCRAFDCSGLGMYWLYDLKKIYPSDMTANGMKGKCRVLTKAQLKKGDWVFRTYKSGSKKGAAYHIGYVVDDALNVIEAKGRKYGVIKAPFSSAYWNAYGRPHIFEKEIDGEKEEDIVFTRVLKKGMTGGDVRELQRLLNSANGAVLAMDGDFGSKTQKAVKAYQKLMGLKVDGIAGEKTITKLGGEWKKANSINVGTWNIKRGKSKKSVCKKIAEGSADCGICGFQEVTVSLMPVIAGKHSYKMCKTVGEYGHATVYGLKLINESVFPLPMGGEARKLHRLVFEKDGKLIHYYNTHIQFTSKERPAINERQMRYVLEQMKADAGEIQILTGDFNCDISLLNAIFGAAGYTVINQLQKVPALITGGYASAYGMDNIIIKGCKAVKAWMYPSIKLDMSDHDGFFAEVEI